MKLLLAVLLLVAVAKAERLSCSVINLYTMPKFEETGVFLNGTLHVVYDREDLEAYMYPNTSYANFMLNDVEILFDGDVMDNYKHKVSPKQVKTDLEGVGYLKKNRQGAWVLTDCGYDLKKNARSSKETPDSVRNGLMTFAHTCVRTELCKKLGNLTEDDFYRASVMKHDFGENSALFDALVEKYPNLPIPNPKNHKELGLQTTLNLFSDFWMASAVRQAADDNHGTILLPDIYEDMPGSYYFDQASLHLTKGSIRNLNNFKRVHNINATHTGLEFALEMEYLLPEAKISYQKYQYKTALTSTEGQIDITLRDLYFKIKASMNYNQSPCRVSATEVKSEIGYIDFNVSNLYGKILKQITGSGMITKNAINIANFVETRMTRIINEPLENFDCEKYRP